MFAAALYQTSDIGPLGQTSHTSSDGTDFATRVYSYYDGMGIGENLEFGSQRSGVDAYAIVLNLLIDDGVTSRGHRANLLSTDFTDIGVSTGMHELYESMCTMNLGYL